MEAYLVACSVNQDTAIEITDDLGDEYNSASVALFCMYILKFKILGETAAACVALYHQIQVFRPFLMILKQFDDLLDEPSLCSIR